MRRGLLVQWWLLFWVQPGTQRHVKAHRCLLSSLAQAKLTSRWDLSKALDASFTLFSLFPSVLCWQSKPAWDPVILCLFLFLLLFLPHSFPSGHGSPWVAGTESAIVTLMWLIIHLHCWPDPQDLKPQIHLRGGIPIPLSNQTNSMKTFFPSAESYIFWVTELLAFKFWPVSRCYYQIMGKLHTDTAIYVT